MISNTNKLPIVVDPKGNQFTKYKNATIITPNFSEFELHARAILGIPVQEIKLLKNGASAVILANKDNSSLPVFSGLEKASTLPDSDFKIFGKPTSRTYRRMAVALSYGISESTESLVERAKHIADIISVD